MRARTNSAFSEFLMRIGNGKEKLNSNEKIEIPKSLFISFTIEERSQDELFKVIPTQIKWIPEDDEGSMFEEEEVVTVDPIERGFIKDWDAMEDLLHNVLYSGLGWEIGNEGQILFTDPLCTPKVKNGSSLESSISPADALDNQYSSMDLQRLYYLQL
ncbi:hypothetical protein FXO38_18448 [Capsicum annuum]|uniref:Uncharacterized protein n=1 Tax=Capsicum annuum TaxID=4072 RepID=A0A2G2YL47_CAPAN|nr:hypothetical protein FXO37_28612 [Capsicum annuum]KAF3647901.1 hypothetical protein FXO38_18448 [Capsicum annuum]PHT70470.1 hypothetical protein T459_25574 [Capsicum annuum]